MQRKYTYQFDVIDKASAPVRKMAGAFGVAKMKVASFGKSMDKRAISLKNMSSRLLNVKNLLIGSFVTSGVSRLAGEVTNTLATFEKFEAVLTNTLGSNSAAQMVLKDITEFAASTPFQVDELTDSWVRLANQGFKPTMLQMGHLGDLASSTGKGMDQLAEAVIDAQVGEFERLKEFGIRAEKSGNRVAFTFKGVKQEVDFTAGSIQQYLLSLGKLEGVQGASASIMETTGGKLSNLQDKFTQLKLNLGQALAPVISKVIDLAGLFTTRLTSIVKWIQENKAQAIAWTKLLVGVGGGFLTIWGVSKMLLSVSGMINTISTAFKVLSLKINIAKIAQAAFNFIAMMNPFGWIALAIGAIVLLVVRFKSVREWLAKFAKWAWEHHPFSWIINVVNKLFPKLGEKMNGFIQGMKDGFKKAFKYISDVFLWPLRNVLSKLFGINLDDLFKKKGGSKSAMTGKRGRLGGILTDTLTNPYSSSEITSGFGKPKGGIGINEGIKSASGAGGNIKNITIHLESLIKGGVNFNTNIAQSKEQLKSELERLLLSVVNDVNYQ